MKTRGRSRVSKPAQSGPTNVDRAGPLVGQGAAAGPAVLAAPSVQEDLSNLARIARLALRADACAVTYATRGEILTSDSANDPAAGRAAQDALALEPGKTSDGLGRAVLAVPILKDGHKLGSLVAVRPAGAVFTAEEAQIAQWLIEQSAGSLDSRDEESRLQRLSSGLAALEGRLAAGQTMGQAGTSLEVVRVARIALGYRGAALYIDDAGQGNTLVCTDGRVPESLPDRLPAGHHTVSADSSAVMIPLRWGERLEGELILFGDSGRRTLPLGAATIERVGSRVAVSLGTNELIDAERHQRQVAEALQQASLAIDRALELNEVLDLILGQVVRAFHCDAANFSSYEGNISRIIRVHGYEQFGLSEADMQAVTFRAEEFVNLRRMARGEAVTIPDTALEPDWVYAPRFEWLRSWAGVPVRYGDTIFGFVMLDSATPGTFDETSTKPLLAFAAHAGAAMHNARLYRRLMQEHTRLQQVHSIGRRFSGSLQRNEILDKLMIATMEALGGATATVFVPSRSLPGRYEPVPEIALRGAPSSSESSPDEEWVRRVGESFAPDIVVTDGRDGRRTQLAFPLTAGDRVYAIAVVTVEGDLAEPGSWLDVLRPVGQQAGLALANAEEHAVVQRRLAELTALQTIVRHIAGRLEVEAVLREVTRQLHANLGFPVVQVYMRQGDELALRQYSGSGTMVSRLPMDQGVVGRAARLRRPEFVTDVRSDPDFLAGVVGTRAEAAVPILAEGDVIGVLNVETSEPEQLDREALELLTLLADQLSIALQNASLYEASQTSVEELEGRVRERTAQLEQVLEQAVAGERVKAQFVADVSHELRTPLTNIGLYLDLLELSHDNRREEYMATLRRETDRLGRLIEQLLSMSHLDTGQAELRPVPTDLNALLKMLVGDRARLIGRKGLKLELLPEPDLPLVQADPQYLMQVMTNLLSNAVNYTPAGGRITLLTSRSTLDGAGFATLSVRDTGPGIPEDEQKQIFDRFYRGVAARASGIAGTGLGLAISRDIMTRHNGQLTVHSVPGSGSSFTLWLPLTSLPPST